MAVATKRTPALLVLALACTLALAACGGGGSSESRLPGPVGGSSDGSTDTTTTEDDPAAGGSLNPLVNLCEVSELSEKASALYPDQDIQCSGGPSTPTPIHQVSDAAWSAGEVDPRTYVIPDEHTIQASIEGNKPGEDSDGSSFIYGGECYSSTGIQCEDQEVEIEGTNCQMRRQVLEIGGPTIKAWQVACYLGHDPSTDLDVRVQTAATKLENGNGIQDFTAAVIRSVRDE